MPLRVAIETLAASARIDLGPRGPNLPRPTVKGSALTTRERGVLHLVSQGHTNREIGYRRFISEKTVSVHVSNAMAKLGALSRYEAAASAERLRLL
jgi:DNA-binding NarL/FixJ family response regulator